jgi:hypothetical protein
MRTYRGTAAATRSLGEYAGKQVGCAIATRRPISATAHTELSTVLPNRRIDDFFSRQIV